MSILDKISNMFGAKDESEAPAEPVVPASESSEASEVPQPDTITPASPAGGSEGEVEEEVPVEKKEETGEGKMNLDV